MHIIKTHIVPDGTDRMRLSDYAFLVFGASSSRKGVKKAIKRGEIRVNGQIAPTGTWVLPGHKIDWLDLEYKIPKVYEMKLEVVFEDDYLAIINKPAGIVVSGNQFRTIENALSANLKASAQEDKLKWPKPVHRLDSPTSGLLIVAKTASSRIRLGQQFEEKLIEKTYQAIACGTINNEGEIKEPIDNKEAHTLFEKVVKVPSLKNEWLCLVNLFPKTGRTHQLRKHLASHGNPIVVDQLYGVQGSILKGKGLFLSAVGLKFTHPITGEPLDISIPAPAKFQSLLEREERRWNKFRGQE